MTMTPLREWPLGWSLFGIVATLLVLGLGAYAVVKVSDYGSGVSALDRIAREYLVRQPQGEGRRRPR